MMKQDIPVHELPIVLSVLGRDYGGLLDTDEALNRLAICETTFDFLRKERTLWARTINGKEYFRVDEIDDLLSYR